ncbi:MAG: tyrosine-protein phosphatase [Ruminococcus sp.]
MNKKIISLTLCVLIFIGSISTLRVFAEDYEQLNTVNDFDTANNSEVNYGIFKKGDINLDGIIDIADATLLQKWLVNIEQIFMIQKCNAIFDNNSLKIDIKNVTEIQKYLAGVIETLENPDEIIVYNQMRPEVQSFIDNVTYDETDYTISKIDDFVSETSKNIPDGCKIKINKAGKLYVFDGATGGTMVKDSVEGDNYIYNLTPNVVSCYVNIVDGDIDQIGEIKPTGNVRMINSSSTFNVRDLGGWECDGGTVKYGKLFRGGEVSIEDATVLVDYLGIRNDINLRAKGEAYWTVSPLGENVNFYVYDTFAWYSISNSDLLKRILTDIFDCVVKDEPVYFHCYAGADRTGTVALILEALLGMSQSDIDKDYELTCFYSGVSTDAQARRRNESEWIGLVNSFSNYDGNTLRDKVVSWVLSLGFSIDTINQFRQAMINGTPEILTYDIAIKN